MKKELRIYQIFILTGIISFFFSLNAESQTYQDSCIRIVWEQNPDKGYWNPDSVLIDSCMCPDMIWEICPYLYANRWYKIYLPNGAINLPAYPHDTTIYVTWQDIDTNFVELRQKFADMEFVFGDFLLKKVYPGSIDTVSLGSRFFVIKFDSYHLIDSVVQFLKTFPDIENPGYTYHLANYSDVKNLDNKIIEFYIIPNPAPLYIEITIGNKLSESLELSESYQIQIYNVFGEQMPVRAIHELPLRIDISHFPNGIYFLRIGDEIGKFVKY